jgi:hypothetical protein
VGWTVEGAMNPTTICTAALRGALISATGVGTEVQHSGTGAYKIVRLVAPAYMELPYVLLSFIGGGLTNDTNNNSLDVIVRVTCISEQMPIAESIAAAIETAIRDKYLDDKYGWTFYAPVRHIQDFEDSFVIQNRTMFQLGAEYRLRAVEN